MIYCCDSLVVRLPMITASLKAAKHTNDLLKASMLTETNSEHSHVSRHFGTIIIYLAVWIASIDRVKISSKPFFSHKTLLVFVFYMLAISENFPNWLIFFNLSKWLFFGKLYQSKMPWHWLRFEIQLFKDLVLKLTGKRFGCSEHIS